METVPTLLTLARHFGDGHAQYRVLATPPDDPVGDSGGELATIELNRRICFPDGQVHSIARRGGPFSSNRELWRGPRPTPSEPPIAVYLHERAGFLRWQHILVVGAAPERRYVLRRRSWLGSPANVDVVPLVTDKAQATTPVLLHAEKRGAWRRRLQAQWLAPAELPLPVALFVLNVLADLDQRAAAAASAGAAGI